MLVITQSQLEKMAGARLEEIASALNRSVSYITKEEAIQYVREGVKIGFTQSLELHSLATSLSIIERAGFDMGKIKDLLNRDDLGKDHKLVPLRMLADILLKQEKYGNETHPNM